MASTSQTWCNRDVCLSGRQRGLLLEPGQGLSLLSSPPWRRRGGGCHGVREEPSCQRVLIGATQGRVHQGFIPFTTASGFYFLSFFSFFFSSSTFYLSRQTETNSSHKIRDASSVTEEESSAGQDLSTESSLGSGILLFTAGYQPPPWNLQQRKCILPVVE